MSCASAVLIPVPLRSQSADLVGLSALGPCRFISPVFEKIAEASHDKAEFYKVDVDAAEVC